VAVNIEVQVGEEDRMFGSVTNQNIAEALAAKGYNIDRHRIDLDQPIKALGTYDVPIKLYGEINTTVKVFVEKAEDQEAE
jgi:large subunit ribosomal protein L9